ncbi:MULTISPECIES: DUF488 domain-containing protein [Mesoflavibacter]|uniref:DUF488 domain-containing protein n=1 Tax=Mesoflavibacter TaxID=444051 RepID=UPI000D0E7094|nr:MULTISPECIES: DUF488 domain-containing protein [Mesoflavibacter]QIJ89889.1 hypothetical protein C7H62_2081 [Mesoflavibacter sp. HG96]QIJ92617.1 hypothetical protein C7H56_2081 [Mesoflavibacter sp. HG37]
MFYRRKIILSLLQLCNGRVEKTKLQKLLFLYSQRKRESEYDFIPYKYGCYSYSANADLVTMVKKEFLLESEEGYTKIDTKDYLITLKTKDRELLTETIERYGNMRNETLIKHTYINFPYYAINSSIAKRILNEEYYKKVLNNIPNDNKKIVFTIGYEGISLEKYLNKLVKNNIKLLVDVRKNPLSMKYGFSKTLLKRFCESLDIKYIHIPEVGINSNQRQTLDKQEDYDILFETYKNTTLKETSTQQQEIINLLNDNNRIALTCFESNICQCHRLPLAESLKSFESNLVVEHL